MLLRKLSVAWGFIGISALLGYAVFRLSQHVYISMGMELSWIHWLALIANVTFMAYSEGYKGFQKNFSPRVAARLKFLSNRADVLTGLLAPLFCLGYFGTTSRRQISVMLLTTMIIVLIMLVSQLSYPWRGIVDAGVVVGLMWGLVSLVYFCAAAVFDESFSHSPELSQAYLERI